MKNLQDFFGETGSYHILVVGDVMLDRYIRGKVDRISPEAPVPVLHWQTSESRLGGAANVALNLARLGAKVSLCGLTGIDRSAEIMAGILDNEGIRRDLMIARTECVTTVKTRVLGGHQHLLRIDEEEFSSFREEDLTRLSAALESGMERHPWHAVILQDYNKGVLTEPCIRLFLDFAARHHIPVAVDPKDHNFFAYHGVQIFKPNLRELKAKMPFPVTVNESDLTRAADLLRVEMGCELAAITLSEHGIFLGSDERTGIYPTAVKTVVDVCGAGDAVISILTLALLMGLSHREMAHLANVGGGVVCGEVGVCPVDVKKMADVILKTDA